MMTMRKNTKNNGFTCAEKAPTLTLTKQDLKLHFFIQVGHEATVVSVDGWDYREGLEMITVLGVCLDGIYGSN